MQPNQRPSPPDKVRPAWHRIIVWVSAFAIGIIALHYVLSWAMNLVSDMNSISGGMTMAGILAVSLLVYAILIAIPFMPGIEVGIALLLLQGSTIAPFVYIATVVGLMTAYLIGRTVPMTWLHKFFCDFGLERVCAYLDKIENMPAHERLETQRAHLPKWLGKLTTDYRYVSIGVLLNVPGTFAIGGGGGILMAAGFSRLFNSWFVFLTLLLATLPVPLIVWTMGLSILGT